MTSQTAQFAQHQPSAKSQALIKLVQDQAFTTDAEFQQWYNKKWDTQKADKTVNYVFATHEDPHQPAEVFQRLRWGGLFVFLSPNKDLVEKLARQYPRCGFNLDVYPTLVRKSFMGLPFFGTKVWFFVARKVLLIYPGDFTDRFTYHVFLQKASSNSPEYVVAKEIPTVEQVGERLRHRFPDADEAFVQKRARKLCETIFPVFLTREAAFLKILERDLPEEYHGRFPLATDLEKDDKGYVKKLYLKWLRKTTKIMDHMTFALQSADMLMRLHENARIIHLDLRLDNFVMTDFGVGLIDYGSSARVGENISESPFLSNLFGEILKSSQIQRMLGAMRKKGKVTSELITSSHQKVDKAVDLFYLVLQMAKPHSNPEIKEVVEFEDGSDVAVEIQKLTDKVLMPEDPKRPKYRSARDVLQGLEEIAKKVGHS
ncbi:MAG: hypothetical protein GC159_23470 [Phycisphaera sp.]|nr:hypothetical protein [Phycisphaera sp.]